MKLPKRPLLAYLMYPFSSGDSNQNTMEARELALRIMKRHPQLTILVPHYTIDAFLMHTLDFVAYKDEHKGDFDIEKHLDAGCMCYGIISKVDVVILGAKLDYRKSAGMVWERAYEEFLNRTREKQIIIVNAETLLEKVTGDRERTIRG